MPVVLLLIGVGSGLSAALAGVIAGLPLPATLALYFGAGSLAVLSGGVVVLASAARESGSGTPHGG